MPRNYPLGAAFAACLLLSPLAAEETPVLAPLLVIPQAAKPKPARTPSEDAEILEFHTLGPIGGQADLFRSANPVRDLAPDNSTVIDAARLAQATARLQRLRDRGIRTIVTFQHPDGDERVQVELEKKAAEAAGLTFLVRPLSNSGPDSFETMNPTDARKVIDPLAQEILACSAKGGVLFHCKAGHDRTGIMTGYLRITRQDWTAERAITEMRADGHDWKKYSKAGAAYSWLEEDLRAFAAKPAATAVTKN